MRPDTRFFFDRGEQVLNGVDAVIGHHSSGAVDHLGPEHGTRLHVGGLDVADHLSRPRLGPAGLCNRVPQ